MSELVVYRLEFVDVAHNQRDRLVQAHRVLPHVVQTLLQRASVFDLGQAVGEGNLPQFVVKLRQLFVPCLEL